MNNTCRCQDGSLGANVSALYHHREHPAPEGTAFPGSIAPLGTELPRIDGPFGLRVEDGYVGLAPLLQGTPGQAEYLRRPRTHEPDEPDQVDYPFPHQSCNDDPEGGLKAYDPLCRFFEGRP
jgi:hypothetical protein